MSQRQLADALGVSQSTVARWESGAGSPSVAVMHALAELVGLRWQLVRADGSEAPACVTTPRAIAVVGAIRRTPRCTVPAGGCRGAEAV